MASGPIASTRSIDSLPLWPARLRPRRAFLRLRPIVSVPCQNTGALAHTPTSRRRSERGPTVAQQWPILSRVAAAVTPRTSPSRPGTALPNRDGRRGSPFRTPRSPGGSERFMRPPSVPPRSPRMCARRHRAWPSSQTAFESVGLLRPRTSGPARCPCRHAR